MRYGLGGGAEPVGRCRSRSTPPSEDYIPDRLYGIAAGHEQYQGRQAARAAVLARRARRPCGRADGGKQAWLARERHPTGIVGGRHAERDHRTLARRHRVRWLRRRTSSSAWQPWALLRSPIRPRSSANGSSSKIARWGKVVHDAKIRAGWSQRRISALDRPIDETTL